MKANRLTWMLLLLLMGITAQLTAQQTETNHRLNDSISAQATVTDEEVKKFYNENPETFSEPEKVRVSYILLLGFDPQTNAQLSDEQKQIKLKQIEAILKRARAGEDFAKLAKKYSEDPGSKDKGGELPPFARASADPQHAMVPEFEAAAFSLETNQISDVVTSVYGYQIIKLIQKIPAKTMPFTEAAPKI